jgi:molecular chaperone HscA
MQARALAESQIEADSLIELTRAALKDDGDLLSDEERLAIVRHLDNLIEKRHGDDVNALRLALAQTNVATMEFAARRMNRSVQKALSGKAIDTVLGKK